MLEYLDGKIDAASRTNWPTTEEGALKDLDLNQYLVNHIAVRVPNEYKFMFASEAISLLCLNKEETDYIMKHVQAEWVSELKTFISDPIEIEKKHEFVKEGSMETQCSSQEYFSQECSLIGSTVISDSEMDKSFF